MLNGVALLLLRGTNEFELLCTFRTNSDTAVESSTEYGYV